MTETVIDDLNLEFHDTPQLWVAYRGCGCAECPKGYGKTREAAAADLIAWEEGRSSATPQTPCLSEFRKWWEESGVQFKARGVNEEYAWAIFRAGWYAGRADDHF